MATIKIVIQDCPDNPKEFLFLFVCDPPLEVGKFPETAAGKIAAIIYTASMDYVKKQQMKDKQKG